MEAVSATIGSGLRGWPGCGDLGETERTGPGEAVRSDLRAEIGEADAAVCRDCDYGSVSEASGYGWK